MREYRLKQPLNVWDSLETACYAAFGLLLLLTENGRGMLIGLALFAMAAWTIWRDFDKRCREIVFSDGRIEQVSRRGREALAVADFCGAATFSDTQRGRVGNVYQTALGPTNHLAQPLLLHTVVQSFTYLPAQPPQAADQVRRQIAEISGLHDFGDVGAATLSELYAKCCFLK
ncbi:hypothetical protein EGK75_05295 [Neisseria weixii]|uniref:Uncharacterized protein n=2 Tax=Neisseria weixii TaxID=1853276 RepID=A0A3N4MZ03_9NEIS|nr:hypothetical protein EGK74_06970 [Neisseria weixii]RPD89209.1 hypothetical protein EGK75_05295 [Neisseria weixii]